MRQYAAIVFAVALVAGCGDKEPSKKTESSTKVAETTAKTDSPEVAAQPAEPPGPGSQTHVNGLNRFKDPGVYVDGHLVGMVRWSELPLDLPVAWHEEEATTEEKAGEHHEPKIVKQRRYRWKTYFEHLGIDVSKIKEIHIYSAAKHRSSAWIAKGSEILKKGNEEFSFRFGNDVFGKPIPACPYGMGVNKCPDNLALVTVYIDKEPPRYEAGHFYFGNERIEGVPYYGTALRGGVRVYFDGPHVATIKRKFLRGKGIGKPRPDGVIEYSLWGFFETAQKGGEPSIDTSKIVEAWIVQNERFSHKLTLEQLKSMTFIAKPGQSGEVFFGPDELPVNALHLSSKPHKKEDLPHAEQFEMHNYE